MDTNKKDTTIIVNAREKTWNEKDISYVQVIELAYGTYEEKETIEYTVTYTIPNNDKSGELTVGESVKVKKDMVFYVNRTDKS